MPGRLARCPARWPAGGLPCRRWQLGDRPAALLTRGSHAAAGGLLGAGGALLPSARRRRQRPAPARPAGRPAVQGAHVRHAAQALPHPGGGTGGRHWARLTHAHNHACATANLSHACPPARSACLPQAHRRWRGRWSFTLAAGLVVLATFWLLLWLVCTDNGATSPTYRRAAAVRRRLEAAAASGGQQLPHSRSLIHRARGKTSVP